MQVALMIPCYIDVFYPQAGIATLELLEKLKVDVVYPFDQTCCGQPMANSGCFEEAQATEELLIRNFSAFDHIVVPSGSCTSPAEQIHRRARFAGARYRRYDHTFSARRGRNRLGPAFRRVPGQYHRLSGARHCDLARSCRDCREHTRCVRSSLFSGQSVQPADVRAFGFGRYWRNHCSSGPRSDDAPLYSGRAQRHSAPLAAIVSPPVAGIRLHCSS
jgi:Cysteine-rich domain